MLFHIGTGNTFHFEILNKILNITFDQEIQLPKCILRKQIILQKCSQVWSSKDSYTSERKKKKETKLLK